MSEYLDAVHTAVQIERDVLDTVTKTVDHIVHAAAERRLTAEADSHTELHNPERTMAATSHATALDDLGPTSEPRTAWPPPGPNRHRRSSDGDDRDRGRR
jgi:hypothetical protein